MLNSPYASVVEQMAVRRMPLAVFAARDSATTAFAEIWAELQRRLQEEGSASLGRRDRWVHMLQAIESLIAQLESADLPEARSSFRTHAVEGGDCRAGEGDLANSQSPASAHDGIGSTPEKDSFEKSDVSFVHSFDTERRDLERCGHVLELCEHKGTLLIVAARSGNDDVGDITGRVQAQIDGSWALQILSGEMSPLAALERRLGRPGPRAVEHIRAIVGGRRLRRTGSRVARHPGREDRDRPAALTSGRAIVTQLRRPAKPLLSDEWLRRAREFSDEFVLLRRAEG